MIYVHNLSSSYKDEEYSFSADVTPVWAVCYAYASEHNLISLLFATREREVDLEEVFPVVYGKHSISCGDYVVSKTDN